MMIPPSRTDQSAFATVPRGHDPRELRANEFMGGRRPFDQMTAGRSFQVALDA